METVQLSTLDDGTPITSTPSPPSTDRGHQQVKPTPGSAAGSSGIAKMLVLSWARRAA
jgi:hypothetical protein